MHDSEHPGFSQFVSIIMVANSNTLLYLLRMLGENWVTHFRILGVWWNFKMHAHCVQLLHMKFSTWKNNHIHITLWIHLRISSIGRPFRSPLRRRRNMAALPLPAAILDDLIPSFLVPGMRSSKMAAGSGRAAILRLRLNGDRKGRPKSWLTSFPAPPSWIQDGGVTSNVWRTS